MTRVFVATPLSSGTTLELPSEVTHHLVQVLRLKAGAPLVLFNGHGGEYAATLERVEKRAAFARVGDYVDVQRESPLRITLAQCIAKGDRMDYTLQKAVELGVSEVIPLLSARSVVRLDLERWEKKLEHWRGIIVSACEQSGRTRVPELHPVAPLDRYLASERADGLHLVLSPQGRGGLQQFDSGLPRQVTLLVGPEGGLDDSELRQAIHFGFRPLALGPRILRTETAGVAVIAALQALWGDWK